MRTYLIGTAMIGMICLGAGCQARQEAVVPEEAMQMEASGQVMQDHGMEDHAMEMGTATSSPASDNTTEPSAMAAGDYMDYSPEAVAREQARGQKVVLFFHAKWCPFCTAADAAFLANKESIPADVTVLKTDYDTQTALKETYGVTYQHTFVQIDASGQKVTSWVSGDVDNLIKNIK